MKAYLLTVVITSVIVALAEMILPSGKLKIVVNMVFSITILLAVVSSLGKVDEMEYQTVFNQQTQNFNGLNYINEHFDASAEKYYNSLYNDKLKENYLIAERVEVEICNLQIIKVKVFLSNLVIPSENEHININVIKSYVSHLIQIDEEKVEIYV
jgi:hypothetical protein